MKAGAPVPEELVTIEVDGVLTTVSSTITIAAALNGIGKGALRRSVSGEMRGPLCGMGICYECRAIVDGIGHRRTCLMTVADGMIVQTDIENGE